MLGIVKGETDFILACIRPNADELDVPRGLDWQSVVRIAGANGVLPLLASRVRALARGGAPGEVRDLLRNELLGNAQRNLRLVRELLAILDLLRARGVRAMPLKGPAMALSVYGSIALRESVDLDLLVRREELAAVREVLLGRGFDQPRRLRRDQEAAVLRRSCDFHFEREDGIAVEPHWNIAPRYFACRFDVEQLWRGAKTTPFYGRAIPEPRAEPLMFLLIVHGLKHCWAPLKFVADLAWLIEKQAPDWTELSRLAESSGMVRAMDLGCYLACEMLGARAPEGIRQRALADKTVRELAAEVRRAIPGAAGPDSLARCSWFHLRARERWRDRLSYAAEAMFVPSPNDWAALPLPKNLNALYYPFHAGRMFVKYGLAPLKRR